MGQRVKYAHYANQPTIQSYEPRLWHSPSSTNSSDHIQVQQTCITESSLVYGKRFQLPGGRDDHVAFGLAVVAHTLHGVGLRQLVDHLPVLTVHGWEAVAPLGLLPLQPPSTQQHTLLTRHTRTTVKVFSLNSHAAEMLTLLTSSTRFLISSSTSLTNLKSFLKIRKLYYQKCSPLQQQQKAVKRPTRSETSDSDV